jgi:acyl-coenzyme A synthetase/AMP-(fatty) acid ligase
MTSKELKVRTQIFALEIIKFTDTLPKTRAGDVI